MPGFVERHKKYFVLLVLFLGLFWLLSAQVKSGRITFLEKPILAVNGAMMRVITGAHDGIVSVGRGYALLVRTNRENGRLRETVNRLTLENQAMNELLLENERLRASLAFRKQNPPASIVAEVIAKETSPSSSTFTVNKGSNDGVVRDLPVITQDGVVGRVLTTLPGTSKIMLITDPGSTIAVRVQRNREEGLLEGKLDRCALKYVSYYVDVQEGDLLVTSGLDGIFPKGLPVGAVSSVSKHESSSFQKVVADAAVRISRVEEVLILKQ